jgi:hypothetical protein
MMMSEPFRALKETKTSQKTTIGVQELAHDIA